MWGTGNFAHWHNLDLGRPRKKTGLVIDLGRQVKPAVTPENPGEVLRMLARHGVNVSTWAPVGRTTCNRPRLLARRKLLVGADCETIPDVDRGNSHQELDDLPVVEASLDTAPDGI